MNFLLLLLSKIIICNCLHLSPIQSDLIIKLIKNPQLTINQRKYINNVLYHSYEKKAIKKAIEFKQLHNHKCRNIIIDDLIIASKFGLCKSIKKYNGNSPFSYFSNFYIDGELFKTLTDYYSTSIIPKKVRIKNKSNYTKNELLEYKKKLNPVYVSYSNYWIFDKYQNSNKYQNSKEINKNKKIWILIDGLDPLIKRFFYLKYDYEFNKIRTNKRVSQLLTCSEEHIRIQLNKVKNDNEFKLKLLSISNYD